MRFLSCLVSICLVFNSIGVFVASAAYASVADAATAADAEGLLRLQKEKSELEKKYFEATLEKSKLENKLLEYKDKYIDLESSLPLEISKHKAPLENKLSDLKRELHNNKEQLLKTLSESERLRRDIASKEERLFRIQDEHARLKTDFDELLRDKKDIKAELDSKSNELNRVELSKTKLESRLDKLESDLERTERSMPSQVADAKRPLEKKIRILNDNLERSESDLDTANKKIVELQKQLDTKITRLSKVSGESQACESQLLTLTSELGLKKQELIDLRSKETELEKKYYSAEREKIEIERMLADVKEKYERLDKTVHSAIAQEREPLQNELTILNNSIRNYEKKTADLEIEIKQLEDKISNKDNKIFSLNAQYKDASERLSQAQQLKEKSELRSKELLIKVDSLTELLNKAVSDNAEKDQGIVVQEQRAEQLSDDYKRLKDMLDGELAAKEELKEKLSLKNKELIDCQEKVQDLSSSILDLKEEAKISKKRLREKHTKLTEPLQQKIVMLNMKIEEQDSIIGSLTQRLDDTTQELGSKLDSADRLKSSQQRAEEELMEAQKEISALKLDIDLLKEQKISAESNLVASERTRLEIEQKMKLLSDELSDLKLSYQKDKEQNTLELQEKIKTLTSQKEALDQKVSRLNRDMGMLKEKFAVNQKLLEESDKTLSQNEETIETLMNSINEKNAENKNLMAKIIALNEELNTTQKDSSLKKAELARFKERIYFLEQNQEFLKAELEKESSARGTIDSSLKEKEEALNKAQENEKHLSQELTVLENKLKQMKNSLAQKVAVAKEPLQAKILELAATLRHEDEIIGDKQRRYDEVKQKIEEKTRSILRLQRKLSPYDEALGQTGHEREQRELELSGILEDKNNLESQIAGVKNDYLALQKELDDAKKEQKKRGLKYRRSQDPLIQAVEEPVADKVGRIVEPLQERINGLAIKVQARSDELQRLYAEHKTVNARYEEKKDTLERLSDETVLYNDALEQTKKEIRKLNADIESLANERLDLKAKLDVMLAEADEKRKELDDLKVEHVEVESSLLDQVVQTKNLLQKKVETMNLQQKEYQRTILAMTGEAEILRKQLQEKDIQIAALDKRISIDAQAREDLEQKFKQQQTALNALDQEKLAYAEQMADLSRQKDEQDKQVEILKERIAVLQKEHDGFAQLIKRNSSEKEYLTRELISKTEELSKLKDTQITYIAQIDNLEEKSISLRAGFEEALANARKPLEEELRSLTEELREKTHAAADCSAKVRELEIVLQQRNKENSRMAIDVSEAQLRLDKTRETMALNMQELDSLRDHKMSLEKKLFQVQVDYDSLLEENTKISVKMHALEADFKAAVEKETNSLNEQLAIATTKRKDMLATKKKLEGQIDTLVKDNNKNKGKITELEDQLELKEYKIAQMEKTVEEINLENRSLQNTVKALNDEIAQARDLERKHLRDYDAMREEKNTLLNERAQLKEIIQKGSGTESELQKALSSKSRELAKVQEKLNQLKRKSDLVKGKLSKADEKQEAKLTKLEEQKNKELDKLNSKLANREELITELTQKIEELQGKLKSKNQELDKSAQAIAKLEKELEDSYKTVQEKVKEIDSLKTAIASRNDERTQLNDANEELKTELSSIKKNYAQLERNKDYELKQVQDSLNKEIKTLKRELDELNLVYQKLKTDMPVLNQELATKEREALDCERELKTNIEGREKLSSKIKALEDELSSLKSNYADKERSLKEKYEASLEQARQESDDLKLKLNTSNKELDYLQKELDSKNDSLADLNRKLTGLKDSNIVMKQKLNDRQKTIGTIQEDCNQRLDITKTNMGSQIQTLEGKLADKEAKIKLLSEHIEENKKIVKSLKGEMKLFVEQASSQNEAYKKSQRDLAAALEVSQMGVSDDANGKRIAKLTEMINMLNHELDDLKKTVAEKDSIIVSRDSEIELLQSDQKELTKFLKKEIKARKENIKELMTKTKALNEIKLQQRELIEKLKSIQGNNN